MPVTLHDPENATHATATEFGRLRRGFLAQFLILLGFLFFSPASRAAVTVTLQTSGGITITPQGANFRSSFGTMNALAIGTAQAGVTGTALSNGALYYTTLGVVANGLKNGDTAVVKAYVSTNFTGSALSAMQIYSCPSTSACNSSAQFSVLGISQVTEATLASGLTKAANTATAGLAIFLPDNDGASSFANGTGSAIVTFEIYVNGAAAAADTTQLNLNNPVETVQSAVQLLLAQAASGRTISAGSDFSLGYGNVNALGIGPGAGLTTVTQAGGIIYSTPYNLLPVFTNLSSTTATLKVCVSTTFTHSAILVLHDSSSGNVGTFSNISTNCGGPTSLTSTANDRSTITRYLGLFVSNVNGATAFTGTDNATLTYTLTVP